MLLVIDVGNTNTTLGVFDGKQLVANWRLTTRRDRTIDEYGIMCRNLFVLSGLESSSINDIAIAEKDRRFRWTAPGPRPADVPGLSESPF